MDTLKQVDTQLADRFEQEITLLEQQGSVLVALSGGVDSAVVAIASVLALGQKSRAVTFNSILSPPQEILDATQVAQEIGITHEMMNIDVMGNHAIVKNEMDRCYLCKSYLIGELKKYQKTHKIKAIVEGTNVSDLVDYRPGIQALKENKIISPHIEAGITKAMIRKIASALKLSISEKPSASCLATRIPYGDPLEVSRLERIGKAEEFLAKILPQSQIRVRDHNTIARIVLSPEAYDLIMQEDKRKSIVKNFLEFGYDHVTLDLQEYSVPRPKDS
jgi:uncharacterized protein